MQKVQFEKALPKYVAHALSAAQAERFCSTVREPPQRKAPHRSEGAEAPRQRITGATS